MTTTSPAHAPGQPDKSFGPNLDGNLLLTFPGFSDTTPRCIVEGPDGKIYIGSYSSRDTDRKNVCSITRVLNDGAIDLEFGIAGSAHITLPEPVSFGSEPCQVFFLADQGEDKILASVGIAPPGQGMMPQFLIQLTGRGELDKNFGDNGIVRLKSPFEADTLQPLITDSQQSANTSTNRNVYVADGKIYLLSRFIDPDLGLYTGVVSRLHIDGTVDQTFGKNGHVVFSEVLNVTTILNDIVVQDGKITVCGYASQNAAMLARLHIDGSFDKSFSSLGYKLLEGRYSKFTSLEVQADGRIVVAGWAFEPSRGLLAAYTPSGLVDRTFNHGEPLYETFDGSTDIYFLSMASRDGKIIVSGLHSTDVREKKILTARYDSNGEGDTAFGNGKGWVSSEFGSPNTYMGMSLQADGKILVVGRNRPSNKDILVTRLLNSVE